MHDNEDEMIFAQLERAHKADPSAHVIVSIRGEVVYNGMVCDLPVSVAAAAEIARDDGATVEIFKKGLQLS